MNIKRLLISAVLPMMCLTVSAQENDNTPQKGDFTVAATVGYNSFTNVTAQPGNLTDYEGSAISSSWTDKKLMVGFEGGWFVGDRWKLNLGGGLNFTHNPGYPDLPGTIDGTTGGDILGEIPNYRAVASQYSCNYHVYTGLDRYFQFNNVSNLMWYAGLRVGFAYALNEQKYDEWTSMGKSIGETWSMSGGIELGVDYSVLPAIFVGISVQQFAYSYNMTSYKPQEGLKNLEADSSDFSIFAAPTIKIGFKF